MWKYDKWVRNVIVLVGDTEPVVCPRVYCIGLDVMDDGSRLPQM